MYDLRTDKAQVGVVDNKSALSGSKDHDAVDERLDSVPFEELEDTLFDGWFSLALDVLDDPEGPRGGSTYHPFELLSSPKVRRRTHPPCAQGIAS